jgi:hypothetical protein
MFIQTENPCLDVALWNQSRYSLTLINGLVPTGPQCLIELVESILNCMSIRIDDYDQCGFGPTAAVAVDGYFRDEPFQHPTFCTPPA